MPATDRMTHTHNTTTVCQANLLAIETALLNRRQQGADHMDKVCQVGVIVNTEYIVINPRRMREDYGTCSVINPRRMREGYGTYSVVRSFIRSVHRATETIAHF